MEIKNRETSNVAFQKPLVYLIAGALLLLAYFLLAGELDFFVDADLAYVLPDIGRVPWDGLEVSYMRYIPYRQMSSMFWKIALLFPGTLFLALFLTLKGTVIILEPLADKKSLHWYLALAAVILIIVFVNVVYHHTPITDDESTYDLQARILLDGKLYGPPPPVEESFDTYFIITKGKYTGKYTLGHPLFLALGMLLGSSYFFPIVLSGALILIIYQISLLLYNDRRLALLSAFLMLISPFYLFTSSTRLSHTTTAFFLGLFMLLFLKLTTSMPKRKTPLLYSFFAGVCAGVAFNVRPLTAIGFTASFAIILLVMVFQRKPKSLITLLVMVAGFLPILALTLWYNKEITGSWLEFPFHYYNPQERLGFGAMLRQGHYVHTPVKSIINLTVSALRMNAFLLGFPISLLFVLVMLFVRPLESGDKLSLAIIGTYCFVYAFYYSPGVSDTGPIYYYELIIPLILLSARGIVIAQRFLKEHIPELRDFIGNFIFLSILLALFTFYPERILHILNLTEKVSEPYRVVEQHNIHNAVVFIRSIPLAGWVFGIRSNSPEFNDDVIYCRLLSGQKNLEVVRHFPERDYYILSYEPEEKKSKLIKVTAEELGQIK
ncbi:glycosyltransferase family 39 protein [Candidatus Sumerlaeota bacterium]|nr:glycosyltransferase family 39 protein [Candidatus Sumerlaeota bacterium]